MSALVQENLRLKELIIAVNLNKPFFDEFVSFVRSHNYEDIHDLISETDDVALDKFLHAYFKAKFHNPLFDGIGRPYQPDDKAKWFFITWILRDAPTQRLQPIVGTLGQGSTENNRIHLIKTLIKFIAPLLPRKEQWEWHSIAEVMLQRLEGSRRALKGGLFEAIVRNKLKDLFKLNNISLAVTDKEIRLNDETYDIEVIGSKSRILMPVKTRETMGGGHANLFTRDIHKAISVAHDNGFDCIPVVIAESWGGNLNELPCSNYIYIPANPNQLDTINPLLDAELAKLILRFASIQ